ncbi:Hypothetical protein A7982_07709 [Minicystis rosea]|nr:Hypothetical protein A7982_07709 [Minicystis rosea]
MRSTGTRSLAFGALLGLLAVTSCNALEPMPVPSSTTCSAEALAQGMSAFAASDVGVYFETGGDAGLALTRDDLAKYLGQIWSGTFAPVDGAPDSQKKATVWLSTSAAAAEKAGLDAASSYAIRRVDEGASTVIVVAAHDATGLTYGAYAFLEQLGARFFHPKEEMVPRYAGPRLPATLRIARAPAMATRGIQFHTLHPIEYFAPFNDPSEANLADAKRVVDWMAKTGQNHLQWVLLSTVDWATWVPHAQAIIEYAHLRGVEVGTNVQVWGGASLQNNYVLVTDEDDWQAQMDAGLDKLLTVGWDTVDLALGEFVSTGPQAVIDWLNHAVEHVAAVDPAIEVNVHNHVGNYENLYVDYMGEKIFYYHLPKYADARLGQVVHTLFFFDVYRDFATYGHPDFHLQHDYIMEELPSRRVSYFPESAYWISADVDVPLFLPEYIHARYIDIHGLVDEARQKGLPPLAGHMMFSSGHEWGYWLTDYLSAKMLWQPDAPLETFLADYAGAFGSCAGDVATAMGTLVSIQTKYLFDARLIAYVQGENTTVDFGYIAGKETHPKRIAFEEVLAMSDGDRATFEADVVAKLEAMVDEMRPIESQLQTQCQGADATVTPWCNELWDGVAIVRNRAEHAAHLYRAVLAQAKKTDPEADYKKAAALTPEAAKIIARREKHYRFDAERLTGLYENPTIYNFGYLRPAHTQCYWRRREQQVRDLIDTGVPAPIASLPGCLEE